MRARAASLHTPFATELRTTVLRCGVWVADDGAGVECEGSWPFTTAPVARGTAGHRLFLLEIAPGGRFPDHPERARRLDALPPGGGGNVLVVSDAAGLRRIWCWRSSRHGVVRPYREAEHPTDDVEVGELARRVAAEVRRPSPSGSVGGRVGELLRAHLAGSTASLTPLEAIERASTPAASRRALQILRSVQVIDPVCGDGTRLLEAAATLEPYHLAALSRLEGWARDARGGSSGRRTGRGAPGAGVAAEPRVRRSVLLHNLFGICADAGLLRIARLRLSAWAEGGEPEGARRGRVPGVVCRLVAPVGPPEPARRQVAEPLGQLRRAWEIVRDLDLAHATDRPSLVRAYRDLAARRCEVVRRQPRAAHRPRARSPAPGEGWHRDPMLHSNRALTLLLQPEAEPVP